MRPAALPPGSVPWGGRSRARLTFGMRLALALTPLLIFVGHMLYGAEHALAAQWHALLSAALATLVIAYPPAGRQLARIDFKWLAPLLIIVLGVAAASLTRLWPVEPQRLAAFPAMPSAGSINLSSTLLEMTRLAALACVFLLGCVHGARRRWARSTLAALLALGTLYAVIELAVFLTGHQILGGGRLTGGFTSANSGALVFGMLTVLALAAGLRAWRDRHGARCLVAAAQTALFALCLFLTASRMGLAATVVAAAVLVLWDFLARADLAGALILLGLMVAAAVSAVLLSGDTLLVARAATIDNDLDVRLQIFQPHWQAFLKAPLAGYGLGSFNDVNQMVMTRDNYGVLEPIRAAHNAYLQWLEEAGLLGAVPLFLLLAAILLPAARRASKPTPDAAALRGLLAASIVVILLALTDFGLQIPSIAASWAFTLGITHAMTQKMKPKTT